MRRMHEASSLASPGEAADWRRAAIAAREPAGDAAVPLSGTDTIEEVILRRGSSRRFERTSITHAELATILTCATCGLEADFVERPARLNDIYVIAHAVEGLAAGAYSYAGGGRHLEPLKYGDFRRDAAFLALEQDLAGDASAAVFFLADLERLLTRLGSRGYRAVQLEAGILGGRLYLAAYALGLGATGLTFYDDEVTRFFSPHAAGKSAIFLVAVGHRARRPAAGG
jgi:SagB-type dehydrogenase family enzyme